MFSSRTRWDRSPNELTVRLQSRLREGHGVLDLTESNPTRCGFAYPADEILGALGGRESLAYRPHPLGSPAAREALAAEYRARGVEMPPEHLVLTSGTSEAYAHLFRLLADPGDRILVPAPSYPLFDLLGTMSDVELVPYALQPESDFAIDLEDLRRAAADPRARAVLAVNPGNPTGSFLRLAELEEIARLCESRGIAFICDEVFGDYAFTPGGEDQPRAVTAAGHQTALTFVLNGLSKMLALPQLKLAWIAASGPQPLLAEAMHRLEIIADTYLSVGTQVQSGLPALLGLKETIQRQIKERLLLNRGYLERRLKDLPSCRALPCEGGWSAILRIPRTQGEEELVLRLLERDGVLVHPGYFFDFPVEGHLVLSLLPQPEILREGIDRLVMRLAQPA
jgi:alanine-synthesizing transaminase